MRRAGHGFRFIATVCQRCGEYLPLGPANDTPEVLIEIDAADRAARGDLSFGGYAGQLAREIATHDEPRR